jgi:6-phosphogluconate dehydrogenase
MKIAVVGLGKMGTQIARKLHEDGHTVIAHNRSPEPIQAMAALGMTAAFTKEEVVAAFGSEQVVLWLMVPEAAVEDELSQWLRLIPENSILIDGGNSNFKKTQQHAHQVAHAGSELMDVGTSGGVWGYANGFSMMVGGELEAFGSITPVLASLVKPEGAYHHFGPSGAGHFVKMVHNAIEYGIMESLAEGYHLLKAGPFEKLDLPAAADVWQHHSVITSWLNALTRDALKENPELNGIDGYVAESGEARWALEVANEHDIEAPAIQAAFDVRIASQKGKTNFATKLLAAMRNAFGGHSLNK